MPTNTPLLRRCERFYKVAEAERLLPYDATTLYRDIRANKMAAVRVGGRVLVPARAIAAMEADMRGQTPDLSVPDSGTAILSTSQAAKILRVSTAVLRGLMKSAPTRPQRFPGVVRGSIHMIAERAIDDIERIALQTWTVVDCADYTAARAEERDTAARQAVTA